MDGERDFVHDYVNDLWGGRLWMGSYSAALHTPTRPDLHIHCAYECAPVDSGAETIWIRLDDAPIRWENKQAWVTRVLDTAGQGVRALDEGKVVVVNCFCGLNRSGLISALILMLAFDMSVEYASAHIRQHRSPLALNNESFNRFLRSVDQEIH
jgi:hypothetical protein